MQFSPSKILQIGTGFFASKTLLSAVELDLFGTLGDGPLPCAALRDKLGLHPRSAADFFDALVALDLLERDGDGPDARYSNSVDASEFLVPSSPAYIGGVLRMANNRLYPFWARLTDALKSGEPQNEVRDEGSPDLFTVLNADSRALEEFVDAMGGLQRGNFNLLSERFDFSSHQSICDVGGSGALQSIAICERHKHVRCISMDLELVTNVARRRIEDSGLTGRIEARKGNFMVDSLPKADVILMGNILHDWDTPTKEMLIRKAWEALPSGGAFIVIEDIIDDARRTNAGALLMSLNMLIETPGGYNFTFAQFNGWCRDAGFVRTERLDLAGLSTAAIAYR